MGLYHFGIYEEYKKKIEARTEISILIAKFAEDVKKWQKKHNKGGSSDTSATEELLDIISDQLGIH